jgi:outer membrane usher protein FimD/PapC
MPILHQQLNLLPLAVDFLVGLKAYLVLHRHLPPKKKHLPTLDAADQENVPSATSAVAVMTVVVATTAADVAAMTVVVIVPSALIEPRVKIASHPSRVSQEASALHVKYASRERIAHHVSHAQKAKSNANHALHVSLEQNVRHVPRVLIVQICDNRERAMRHCQQKLQKL